jgi:MFS family permease
MFFKGSLRALKIPNKERSTDMVVEGKKKYGIAVKAAVLSIIMCEYTISITNPGLGAIRAAMPDVDPVLIRMIQSLPSLTLIVIAMLEPIFERFLKKKTLLIIAACLMLVAGVAPALVGANIWPILACRALYGAGRGIVFPFAMAFVVELFEGKEKDQMMGYRSTTGNVAGIVFLQLGGLLATINWRYTFWGVLIMIPFILLIIAKLPEPEKKPFVAKEGEKKKSALSPKTWLMIILNLVFMFFTYAFLTDVAIIVTDLELGPPTMAANIMTTFSVVSAVCGLLFGTVFRPLFKKYTVTVGMLFIALCFLIISGMGTLSGCFLGAACFGVGFSIYNCDMYLSLTEASHISVAATALSFFMAFNAVGQFGSPIVLAFISRTLGIDAVPALANFVVSGPVLIVATVGVVLVKLLFKSKKPLNDINDKSNAV